MARYIVFRYSFPLSTLPRRTPVHQLKNSCQLGIFCMRRPDSPWQPPNSHVVKSAPGHIIIITYSRHCDIFGQHLYGAVI